MRGRRKSERGKQRKKQQQQPSSVHEASFAAHGGSNRL
jgi:hypothetical protein